MDDLPLIQSLEELMSQKELADFFGMKPATIRDYMRGNHGLPPLPYLRLGNKPLFSKRQVAWWLRRVQEQVDTAMVNVRHARNELGGK